MRIMSKGSIFTRLLVLTAALGILPILALAFLLVLPLDLSLDEVRLMLGVLVMALPVATLCMVALATKAIRSTFQKLEMAQRQFYSGKLGVRLPLKGDKDSVSLYRGFNVMAELVNESLNRMVKEEKMKALATQASHVAHDMRSPLSVLKSYTGLDPNKFSDDETQEYQTAAKRSVDKLLHMADDLVDYAKASRIDRSPKCIEEMIDAAVIPETKQRAEEYNVEIRSTLTGKLVANIDSYKMERVLVNLVHNSIQSMNGDGGKVDIIVETVPDNNLLVRVEDNGKGIDPWALPKVFESFFTKGKKGGTGLGLAYCKQVVEAHGGTIEVDSELGKGTSFTIRIPNCVVS